MELQERQEGRWSDAKPQPIVLPSGYQRHHERQQQSPRDIVSGAGTGASASASTSAGDTATCTTTTLPNGGGQHGGAATALYGHVVTGRYHHSQVAGNGAQSLTS